MTEALSSDPDFKAFAAEVHAHLIPMMMDSGAVVSLVPKGEADIKYAVELGLAIMLDKPLVLAVPKGVEVPEHLARAADGVVYVDFDDEDSAGKAQQNIAAMLVEMEDPPKRDPRLRLTDHDARQLSRMLFDCRELIDMLVGLIRARSTSHADWPFRVIKEIDDFRAAQGWSPHGFGGERGAD